jgi:hypothetical protein
MLAFGNAKTVSPLEPVSKIQKEQLENLIKADL